MTTSSTGRSWAPLGTSSATDGQYIITCEMSPQLTNSVDDVHTLENLAKDNLRYVRPEYGVWGLNMTYVSSVQPACDDRGDELRY